MNINQKFVINIISIITFIVTTIVIIALYIVGLDFHDNINELMCKTIGLACVLYSPICLIPIFKFIFIKLNWNMNICLAVCGSIGLILMLIYSFFGILMITLATEPY